MTKCTHTWHTHSCYASLSCSLPVVISGLGVIEFWIRYDPDTPWPRMDWSPDLSPCEIVAMKTFVLQAENLDKKMIKLTSLCNRNFEENCGYLLWIGLKWLALGCPWITLLSRCDPNRIFDSDIFEYPTSSNNWCFGDFEARNYRNFRPVPICLTRSWPCLLSEPGKLQISSRCVLPVGSRAFAY